MTGMLVSRIKWLKKKNRWLCSLILYDKVFTQIWLESGRTITFNIQSKKYCVGYTKLASNTSIREEIFKKRKIMKPCPSKSEVKKRRQCSFCYSADVIHPCLICDGTECLTNSIYTKKQCQKSTAYVYIASFGINRVKIGAAHKSRIPSRWIEQGANYAKRIIVGNGIEVRRFEKLIQDSLDVLSGLRTEKKIDTLWKCLRIDNEINAIQKTEKDITKKFPNFPFFKDETNNLNTIYGLPHLDRRPLELKVKDNTQVSGKILGVKGSLMLLDIANIPHFLNLNNIIGRKIDFGKSKAFIIQSSLDKY
jgi:hypothetical protein